MKNSFSAPHHFNSEDFLGGRRLITEGMVAIKANVREENFQAARETLGKVLHTLQVKVQLGIKKLKGKLRNEVEKQTGTEWRTGCKCVSMYYQDFYSHSNWVELGYTEPYINLIRPDLPLENLAGVCMSICISGITIGGACIYFSGLSIVS